MRHYLADLTGSTEVLGTLTAAGLVYPSSDGTNNQVIKTDGSNTLSFTSTIDTASYVNVTNIDGDITADSVAFTDITGFPSNVVSSSTQTIANLPAGTVSGSSQVDVTGALPAGTISGSSQVDFLFIQGTGNIVSSSQQIDFGAIANTDGLVSASTQIDHDATTNFVAGEHFLQSAITTVGTVTTGNVNAILPNGVVSSSAQITAHGFISESFSTGGTGILSGSAQIASEISGAFTSTSASFASTINGLTSDYTELTNVPDGIVSSSTQTRAAFTAGTNVAITNGVISSTDTNTQLSTEAVQDIVGAMFTGNTETRISATYQDGDGTIDLVATDQSFTLADGVVSSSVQIDHDATTNFVAGEHFTQANITTVGTVTTGDVSAILPAGTVSGSAQVDVTGALPAGVISGSQSQARAQLGVDASGTDNSTDVTLAGTPDYLTISGQTITRNQINLTTDVTGDLPVAEGGTGASTAAAARTNLGVDAAGTDNSTDVTLAGSLDYLTISGQAITRNAINLATDVTGTLPVGNMAATALTTVQTAANQTAHLALTTQEGDVVVRSDENKTYMHNGGTAGTMADFTELATPTDSVTSVNGNTGAVTVTENVTTNLSITGTTGARTIVSSDGTNAVIPAATDSVSGVMSATDHTKLTGIETSADVTDTTNVVAALTAGTNITIGSDGTISSTNTNTQLSQEQVEDYVNGVIVGGTNVTATYDDAAGTLTIASTDTNTQLTSAQVRGNISGTGLISYNSSTGVISTTANNYTLPEATSTVRGGIELFSDTDQSVAANAVSTTANRTYGIQLNSAGQAVVNVPWSDSNTVYTHPTHPGDDFSVDTGALTGATVVSDIDINVTTDTLGHVTDANGTVSTRTLTLANLGYTGATNANNYSLPQATTTVRGGIELFSDTDQSVAANAVSSTANRTYGIQLNSANQAVVNVPWSDTNTDTNTFRTVTAGGNTLGASETLAFTAGTNVTITEAAGAVTITSTDTNTQLSTEEVQDIVGAMFTGNTETRISATYQDGDGTIDLVATDQSYTLPEATSTVRGGIELFSDTDQSVAANTVSTTAGRTYGIQLNSAGQAVVNVPWTDTDTDTNTFRTVTAGGNTLGTSETLAFTAGNNVTITEAAGAVTINADINAPTLVTESFSNVNSYTVNHNLNTQDVIVQVYDNNNNVIVPSNIQAASTTTVVLTFSQNRSGRVVIGKAGHVVSGSASGGVTGGTGVSVSNNVVSIAQAVGTSDDLQFDSLGVGTAASGVTGEIRATNDVTAFYSSDKRLKENITPIQGSLDKVAQLGGYEFDWIPKEGVHSQEGHDIGVIAQEVEAIFPELVTTRDNGYKAVKYEKLTAVLLQAVKELTARVEKLENK